jgi:hypothetical protein
MRSATVVVAFVSSVLLCFPGCPSTERNPCDGVTCSGHGTCVESDGDPECLCFRGFEAAGLDCVPVGTDGDGDSDGDGDGDVDSDTDGDVDADSDTDVDMDSDGDADRTFPSIVSQTAGGGTAATESYRLRMSIGAPQPIATGTTSGYRLRLGPGSR